MKIFERIHSDFVYSRRVQVLSHDIEQLIPQGARVLDVGCGDGLIASLIQSNRPDIEIEGVDVLLRPNSYIPISRFDGRKLPYEDNAFDAVTITDVLHHIEDPTVIIREAIRVSRNLLIIKDHARNGLLAGSTLHFMDWIGNARHGVAIPANYWPRQKWRDEFSRMDLTVRFWTQDVALYPWWADWAFGRSLHFIAALEQRCAETGNHQLRQAA